MVANFGVKELGSKVGGKYIAYLKALGMKGVFDPFAGIGTVLALANKAGLDALGIEFDPELAASP